MEYMQPNQEVEQMGTLHSKVPALMQSRGLNVMDLVRRANLSYHTAYRVTRGDTRINTETISRLLTFFSLRSIDELFEYREDSEPGSDR